MKSLCLALGQVWIAAGYGLDQRRSNMAKTPEGLVKEKITKLLKEYEVYYFMPIGGMYSKIGVPDVIGCLNGRFIAVEAKAGKGKTTALQDRELKRIKDAGGVSLVINETNLDELRQALEEIKHAIPI